MSGHDSHGTGNVRGDANGACGYEFSVLRDAVTDYGHSPSAVEALDKIEATHNRMRAALEDVAAGRCEFDLTPRGADFDFVTSFWFLVKIAEGVVGDA